MPLDFPASPTNGQVYGSYVYNSTVGAWQSKEDPATVATVSTTAPASANPGDLWYDSDDGTSYMYYNDGTSAQWVELLSSGVPLLNTKANLAGGNALTGVQSITSTATTQTPLIVNGIASQSANLQEWKDSSGTVIASVMASGNIRSNAFGSVAAGNSYMVTASDTNSLLVSTNVASNKGFVVRGVPSQTANLQEWQDSTTTPLIRVTSSGNLSVGAASTPLEKIHATGRILGSSSSWYSSGNVIGTSIGPSTTATENADVDMRRWTGSANNHGTGRIEVDSPGTMRFYTDSQTTNTYASTERMRINASGLTVSGPTVTTAISDTAYNRILNPAGGYLNGLSSSVTGAIRIVLPVGWTDHMHKFTVSVFHYLTGKSFTVEIAGYNYTGGSWFNPTAYIVGQQDIDVNYTVRFGYTAGGKACIYIGETTSVWNYPKIAVNNVLVGQSGSSSTWLSGWVVDVVTAFENVSRTVANTQIVGGLVPLLPTSVSVNSGSASVSSDGTVSFSGGVTNLRVNGCFSSTYRYYRVMFEVEATSSGMDLMFQLINLGSGYVYGRIGTYSGPTFTQTYASGSAAAMISRSNGGNGSGGWLDIINPSHAKTKRFLSQSVDSGFMLWLGSINGDLGTYSDFQIYSLQGGTLTSGSLKVYGYR